jgi:hypothetical protein
LSFIKPYSVGSHNQILEATEYSTTTIENTLQKETNIAKFSRMGRLYTCIESAAEPVTE